MSDIAQRYIQEPSLVFQPFVDELLQTGFASVDSSTSSDIRFHLAPYASGSDRQMDERQYLLGVNTVVPPMATSMHGSIQTLRRKVARILCAHEVTDQNINDMRKIYDKYQRFSSWIHQKANVLLRGGLRVSYKLPDPVLCDFPNLHYVTVRDGQLFPAGKEYPLCPIPDPYTPDTERT